MKPYLLVTCVLFVVGVFVGLSCCDKLLFTLSNDIYPTKVQANGRLDETNLPNGVHLTYRTSQSFLLPLTLFLGTDHKLYGWSLVLYSEYMKYYSFFGWKGCKRKFRPYELTDLNRFLSKYVTGDNRVEEFTILNYKSYLGSVLLTNGSIVFWNDITTELTNSSIVINENDMLKRINSNLTTDGIFIKLFQYDEMRAYSLTNTGNLYYWDNNMQFNKVVTPQNIALFCASYYNILLVTKDDPKVLWVNGENSNCQVKGKQNPTVPSRCSGEDIRYADFQVRYTFDNNITNIQIADRSCFVLLENGLLYSFGNNERYNLGFNDRFSPVNPVLVGDCLVEKFHVNDEYTTIICKDGTVKRAGYVDSRSTRLTTFTTSVPITNGTKSIGDILNIITEPNYYMFIFGSNGTFVYGEDANGYLGIGNENIYCSGEQIKGLNNVTKIATPLVGSARSSTNTYIVKENDSWKVFGKNLFSQFVPEEYEYQSTLNLPVDFNLPKIANVSNNFEQLLFNQNVGMGITENNKLLVWGDSFLGKSLSPSYYSILDYNVTKLQLGVYNVGCFGNSKKIYCFSTSGTDYIGKFGKANQIFEMNSLNGNGDFIDLSLYTATYGSAMTNNNSIIFFGDLKSTNVLVKYLNYNVTSIKAMYDTLFAITSNNTLLIGDYTQNFDLKTNAMFDGFSVSKIYGVMNSFVVITTEQEFFKFTFDTSKRIYSVMKIDTGNFQVVEANMAANDEVIFVVDTLKCLKGFNGPNCDQTDTCDPLIDCGGHGVCLYGKCVCFDNQYTGDSCETPLCFGLSSQKGACNARGTCVNVDTCVCDENYFGEKCEINKCFEILSNDTKVCSGKGVCHSFNNCSCTDPWTGLNCDVPVCFGVNASEVNVCSGHGRCLNINQCECNVNEWSGKNCEIPICFNTLANESSVCSSHGSCVTPNTCDCDYPYFGTNCSLSGCYFNNNCSFPNGTCIGEGICSCSPSFHGGNCSLFNCLQTNNCSGNGECVGPSTCLCNENYYGEMCITPQCFRTPATHNSVCNGQGMCVGVNNCQCYSLFYGKSCEINIEISAVVSINTIFGASVLLGSAIISFISLKWDGIISFELFCTSTVGSLFCILDALLMAAVKLPLFKALNLSVMVGFLSNGEIIDFVFHIIHESIILSLIIFVTIVILFNIEEILNFILKLKGQIFGVLKENLKKEKVTVVTWYFLVHFTLFLSSLIVFTILAFVAFGIKLHIIRTVTEEYHTVTYLNISSILNSSLIIVVSLCCLVIIAAKKWPVKNQQIENQNVLVNLKSRYLIYFLVIVISLVILEYIYFPLFVWFKNTSNETTSGVLYSFYIVFDIMVKISLILLFTLSTIVVVSAKKINEYRDLILMKQYISDIKENAKQLLEKDLENDEDYLPEELLNKKDNFYVRKILISIGVDNVNGYEIFENNLTASQDAESVATSLKDYHQFDDYRVIKNEMATKDNIKNTIRELKTKRDDLLVLYFAGHGAFDRGDGPFIVYCYDDIVDFGDIITELRIKRAKHKLILLDSCFSGGIFRGGGKRKNKINTLISPSVSENEKTLFIEKEQVAETKSPTSPISTSVTSTSFNKINHEVQNTLDKSLKKSLISNCDVYSRPAFKAVCSTLHDKLAGEEHEIFGGGGKFTKILNKILRGEDLTKVVNIPKDRNYLKLKEIEVMLEDELSLKSRQYITCGNLDKLSEGEILLTNPYKKL